MKQKVHITIIPTYKIDQVNDYTMFDSSDNSVGDLVTYEHLLEEIKKQYNIEKISVRGGEIALLSDLYFDLLYRIINLYTKNVEVYTHFNTFNPALINGVDVITVPYNFTEKEDLTFLKNIKAAIQIGKIINIQTLDVACENENPNAIITMLNKMNIKSWEIIPYQTTEYTNAISHGYECFENCVLKFIKYTPKMNFAFHNKLQLDGIIQATNYDIENIYLTPHNKLALAFYDNSVFKLKEYDTLDELTIDLNKNIEKQDKYCDTCKVKLKCMANYYKNFNLESNSCPGFSNLIYKYASTTKKEKK